MASTIVRLFACQSWNKDVERRRPPAQPSPTNRQATDGDFPWLLRRGAGAGTARG
jgi:hypothetical protein